MTHEIILAAGTSGVLTPTPAPGIVARLQARMAQVLAAVEQQEFWRVVTSPQADAELLNEVMRQLFLEIFSYQEHAIEGAITAIAQMPRTMPVRMIKAMLRHQAEEFDHGEMALRSFVALGGDEQHARSRHRMSPAAYSVAAVWRTLGVLREPFAYLGALYPFEGLTPIVCSRVKAVLEQRGFQADALEFLEFHATEDPKHTELVTHLIEEVVARFPEAEPSVMEGLERFLAIYPIPVWDTAYRRALALRGPG